MLDWALKYARRGWPIFPLKPRDKIPLTEHGFKNASTDEGIIFKWWTEYPDANIGIATGAISGLIILDADGPEGEDSLKGINTVETPLVKTGKGIHVYYRHPGYEVRNFARKLPGLDLRGDGGYVVAPPSIHPSGASYEWAISYDTEIAEAPEWLMNLIKSDQSQTAKKIEGKIPEGRRNVELTSLAGAMRRKGLNGSQILPSLAKVNVDLCVPPLPENEVQMIAEGMERYEPSEPIGETKIETEEYESLPKLYEEIRLFHYDHIDFWDERFYHILTGWTLATWKIDKLYEIGYPYFHGIKGSGKSRAMECLQLLCYNSEDASLISTPAIYRLLLQGHYTFFLDEFDQYDEDKKNALIGVLNSGYTKGKQVILCDQHDNNEVKRYPTFGAKAIGTIEGVKGSFLSRCIQISMIRNVRKINFRIDEERARKIRAKIEKWRQDTHDDPIENVEQLFRDYGIENYRLIQILNAIVAVSPADKRHHVLEYAKEQQDQIDEDEETQLFKELFNAVEIELKKPVEPGTVKVSNITDLYNSNKTEEEQLTPRKIGALLTMMGLNKVIRYNDGSTGRDVNPTAYRMLTHRFKKGQQSL